MLSFQEEMNHSFYLNFSSCTNMNSDQGQNYPLFRHPELAVWSTQKQTVPLKSVTVLYRRSLIVCKSQHQTCTSVWPSSPSCSIFDVLLEVSRHIRTMFPPSCGPHLSSCAHDFLLIHTSRLWISCWDPYALFLSMHRIQFVSSLPLAQTLQSLVPGLIALSSS